MKPEELVRLVFSTLAAFLAALVGLGICGIQSHNLVVHGNMDLSGGTLWVALAAPWVILVPFAVLVGGIICRQRPWALEVGVNLNWLVAVIWPAVCVLAWYLPTVLL